MTLFRKDTRKDRAGFDPDASFGKKSGTILTGAGGKKRGNFQTKTPNQHERSPMAGA